LDPDDLEKIIIPYLEKVYTFEDGAHVKIILYYKCFVEKSITSNLLYYEKIYGIMQKYIAKSDEFSGALLWASVEYSNPISW